MRCESTLGFAFGAHGAAYTYLYISKQANEVEKRFADNAARSRQTMP